MVTTRTSSSSRGGLRVYIYMCISKARFENGE
jgi:hypothetical protein